MEKFLIEVPHGEDKTSCQRAIEIFLSTGSHFLTNAEWGCKDGAHSAWLIVEVNSKEEAVRILPSGLKHDAKIVKLNRFTRQDIDGTVMDHHVG